MSRSSLLLLLLSCSVLILSLYAVSSTIRSDDDNQFVAEDIPFANRTLRKHHNDNPLWIEHNDDHDNKNRAMLSSSSSSSSSSTRISLEKIIGGYTVWNASTYSAYAIPMRDDSSSSYTLCGGTLIHPDIIVTAAHCYGAFRIGVYLGTINMKEIIQGNDLPSGSYLDKIPTDFEYPHPSYCSLTRHNDIMLVKLKRPAVNTIQPILWNMNSNVANDANINVTVIGYGDTSSRSGNVSPTLQAITVTIFSNLFCARYRAFYNSKIQICAGSSVNNKDACEGDSGGPLLMKWNGIVDILVGLVSYGSSPCAIANVPTIYTRMSAYQLWIQSFICHKSNNNSSSIIDCSDVLQQEQRNSYRSCPTYQSCSRLPTSRKQRYQMTRTIAGICYMRCVKSGFWVRWHKFFGWSCGACTS